MAERGYQRLTEAGYLSAGFDHFALPGDGLAQAALGGRLRRNFQGFTDDQSDILIGFGASAISMFPGLFVQNEKNSGRYRMLTSARRFAGTRGVLRTADDRAHGRVIEALLCAGRANLRGLPSVNRHVDRLSLFIDRGLARLQDGLLTITPRGLPYARTIAATFDRYREEGQGQFSNAI
jgi:oxygen-independent coproporphyrinogen-3 oxidase